MTVAVKETLPDTGAQVQAMNIGVVDVASGAPNNIEVRPVQELGLGSNIRKTFSLCLISYLSI